MMPLLRDIEHADKVTTAPADEPVTLAEFKTHARIDHNDADDDLTLKLFAARQAVERILSRALITQTITLKLDRFPSGEIQLRRPPIQSVTSIAYVDTAGDSQTLDSSLYTVDVHSEPGRILPAYGTSWPDTRRVPHAVTIVYVAGYGDAGSDVPEQIRTAIMQIASTLEEYHASVASGPAPAEVPQSARWLLEQFDWGRYA